MDEKNWTDENMSLVRVVIVEMAVARIVSYVTGPSSVSISGASGISLPCKKRETWSRSSSLARMQTQL